MFHVYENWTHDYVCVHRADCFYCNEGKGRSGKAASSPNGKWHGPWSDFADASQVARQLNRASYYDCAHCRPQQATVIPNADTDGCVDADYIAGVCLNIPAVSEALSDFVSNLNQVEGREMSRRVHLLQEGAVVEANRHLDNIARLAEATTFLVEAMDKVRLARLLVLGFETVNHAPEDVLQH